MCVCVFASTLYNFKYDLRKGIYLIYVGPGGDECAWEVCLGSVLGKCFFMVFICSGVYYLIVLSFCEVFYDYGGVYCCEVGVYILCC